MECSLDHRNKSDETPVRFRLATTFSPLKILRIHLDLISENRLVLRADQLRAIEYHYKSAYNTVPMCMKMFSFGMDWAYASKGLCCSRSPQEVLSVLILAGIKYHVEPSRVRWRARVGASQCRTRLSHLDSKFCGFASVQHGTYIL